MPQKPNSEMQSLNDEVLRLKRSARIAAFQGQAVGPTGATGSQGIQGPTGPAGTTDYTVLSNKPVLPANTTAVTSKAITAYNSTTGAFTLAQLSTSDISGYVAPPSSTDLLTEGVTNLYYTAARVDARIAAATIDGGTF